MPLTHSQQKQVERMFDKGIAHSLETGGAATRVPRSLIDGLRAYAVTRCPTGDFLRACLENDFLRACGKADSYSAAALKDLAVVISEYLPTVAYGDRATVDAWLALGWQTVPDPFRVCGCPDGDCRGDVFAHHDGVVECQRCGLAVQFDAVRKAIAESNLKGGD